MYRSYHTANLVGAFSALAITACSTTAATLGPDTAARAPAYSTSEVEIDGEGGLGGFATHWFVSGSERSYLYTMHRICSVPNWQPAVDSASGAIAADAADSLSAQIDRSAPFSLSDDYGITVGGADMITYTVRITVGSRTKTIRADDGTMPVPVRRILDAVRTTITSARR